MKKEEMRLGARWWVGGVQITSGLIDHCKDLTSTLSERGAIVVL